MPFTGVKNHGVLADLLPSNAPATTDRLPLPGFVEAHAARRIERQPKSPSGTRSSPETPRSTRAMEQNIPTIDSYQPDEVKVVVKEGYVRINAKHVGGDEDNSDIRESTRTIRIPEGVDQSKIHCFQSSENHYTVEGPMLPNEDEEMEVKLENVPAITDGNDVDMQVAEQSRPYQENLDLSVFDPDHINIKRKKNVVSISADHNREENGIRVQRSFRKEFALPNGVDYRQVKAARGADGKVAIMAPRMES